MLLKKTYTMKNKPNFVIFLTDDMGYGDLSCMGCTDFRTPHLDRMANEGARFTSWYSNSPVCSPSRASLLSGRYPQNAGVSSILAGHRRATGLPNTVPTLPSLLKEHGYSCYMSGKWHLGLADGCRPENHGFDRWFGHMAGCIDYYSHIFYWGMNQKGPGVNPTHDLWEDGKEVWDNGNYMTHAIVDKAIEYIREARESEQPFMLYVPFNAPHYPMHAPEEYMCRFSHLSWDRQVMAAMLSCVDDGVGEIMAELERQGIAENTMSIFTSDNGPSRESRNWLDGNLDPYYGGTSGGLKGHKFSLFEGGIRLPGLVHWPAEMESNQVIDAPVASMDVLPTILDILGEPPPQKIDGQSILPLLKGGGHPPEREICWSQGNQLAMRKGKWKLVLNGQLVEGEDPQEDIFLSNIEEDMAENTNLAEDESALCKELSNSLRNWKHHIDESWEVFQEKGNASLIP